VSDLGSQTPYPSQAPPGSESQPPQFEQTIGGPSGPRAGFWQRFGAVIVDALVLLIPNVIFFVVFSPAVANLLSLLLSIGYYTYFEGGPTGQTVGKRAIGIRVVDFNTGGPIGYPRGLLRWLGRIPSTLVFFLGYFWMLWDREKQCWQDKIAGTVVVPIDAYPVR
jgi:uncharacterized RDD family membrane protein YckC